MKLYCPALMTGVSSNSLFTYNPCGCSNVSVMLTKWLKCPFLLRKLLPRNCVNEHPVASQLSICVASRSAYTASVSFVAVIAVKR